MPSIHSKFNSIPHSVKECFTKFTKGSETLVFHNIHPDIKRGFKFLSQECEYVTGESTSKSNILGIMFYRFLKGVGKARKYLSNWDKYNTSEFLSNKNCTGSLSTYIKEVLEECGPGDEHISTSNTVCFVNRR